MMAGSKLPKEFERLARFAISGATSQQGLSSEAMSELAITLFWELMEIAGYDFYKER